MYLVLWDVKAFCQQDVLTRFFLLLNDTFFVLCQFVWLWSLLVTDKSCVIHLCAYPGPCPAGDPM